MASFKDIFRAAFERSFLAAVDKNNDKTARKASNLKSHYLVYNESNLVDQLIPFLGKEQATRIARKKTDLFIDAVQKKYKNNPRLAEPLTKLKAGGTFSFLIDSTTVSASDIYDDTQRFLSKTFGLSGPTWKAAILQDWLKENDTTLDQVLFGNDSKDGGLLNPFLDKEGDVTTINEEKLRNELNTRLQDRYKENEAITSDSGYKAQEFKRLAQKLKDKITKYGFSKGTFSFDNMNDKKIQEISGYILKIIYILGQDPGARALLAVQGGLDLGHVVSVHTETLGYSVMQGILANVKDTGLTVDAIEKAQGNLNLALTRMFDDPSIPIEEVFDPKTGYGKAFIFENSKANRSKGGEIQRIASDLTKGAGANLANKTKLVQALTLFVDSLEDEMFNGLTRELNKLDFSELLTSPSYMKNLGKIVDTVWDTGHVSGFDKSKVLKIKTGIKLPNKKITKRLTSKKPLAPNKLRSMPKIKLAPLVLPGPKKTKQSFLNLTKIKLYVNSHMHDRMQENMKGQRLHYRSGRLARSAQVHNIQQTRKDTIALYYTYMKNPYATFAKGGKQHTSRRDVDNLIMASARSLAREVVANKFKLSIRGT